MDSGLKHPEEVVVVASDNHELMVGERRPAPGRHGDARPLARLSLTLNTYSHVVPALQREAADRMEAVLSNR